MSIAMEKNQIKNGQPGKLLKIILFWTNFFFIIFLSKKILGSNSVNDDFLLKNILTFIFSIILSGAMLHFLKLNLIKLSIPVIWLITILLVYY
jgi:hypothetical protein